MAAPTFDRRERRLHREWLDELPVDRKQGSLRDLRVLNRWFGGHWVLRGLLAEVAPADGRFSLLDVGAASGDMAGCVRRWYPQARVVALDHCWEHLAGNPAARVAGDAFRLPFPTQAFDFVFCSLFLHHFSTAEVITLLRTFRAAARRAVLAIDLERHPLAYYFLPTTRWLCGWDAVTMHDGAASVAAAFTPGEWQACADEAGLSGARVRRHHPWFRLSLVADVEEQARLRRR